jgi:hypothetical protein
VIVLYADLIGFRLPLIQFPIHVSSVAISSLVFIASEPPISPFSRLWWRLAFGCAELPDGLAML